MEEQMAWQMEQQNRLCSKKLWVKREQCNYLEESNHNK